jgi:hypothetical protein
MAKMLENPFDISCFEEPFEVCEDDEIVNP